MVGPPPASGRALCPPDADLSTVANGMPGPTRFPPCGRSPGTRPPALVAGRPVGTALASSCRARWSRFFTTETQRHREEAGEQPSWDRRETGFLVSYFPAAFLLCSFCVSV